MSERHEVPQAWVRQITEEVLRRLEEQGGSGPAGPRAEAETVAPGPPALAGPLTGAVPTPQCPPCARDVSGVRPGAAVIPPAESVSSATEPNAEGRADHYQLLLEHGVERLTCSPLLGSFDRRLADRIDHTLLRPEATDRQIAQLCEEAHCHGFATVCVQPIWVPLAVRILEESRVRVCTVVGFPHGANRAEVKAYETQLAVAQGAREIDMVIPVGAMKSGDLKTVASHVRAVVRSVVPGIITKVILETAYLTREEKVAACRIARDEGATFVKTSTGFASAGATLEDIRLMRETVGPRMGIKAAGGIRDRETALRMVEAGATRIGASASIRIASGISN